MNGLLSNLRRALKWSIFFFLQQDKSNGHDHRSSHRIGLHSNTFLTALLWIALTFKSVLMGCFFFADTAMLQTAAYPSTALPAANWGPPCLTPTNDLPTRLHPLRKPSAFNVKNLPDPAASSAGGRSSAVPVSTQPHAGLCGQGLHGALRRHHLPPPHLTSRPLRRPLRHPARPQPPPAPHQRVRRENSECVWPSREEEEGAISVCGAEAASPAAQKPSPHPPDSRHRSF